MQILAIDPGNIYSGYAMIDEHYRPLQFGKIENDELRAFIVSYAAGGGFTDTKPVIEMVKSYGMQVGQTVFDTCVWIGRFTELIVETGNVTPTYVGRKEYIVDLIGTAKAKDANVVQYLVDRFAKDAPNHGKGTKNAPGWFYGFKQDVWQAYAIAVWAMDKERGFEYV